MMPFKFTSDMSVEDAQKLAENLGLHIQLYRLGIFMIPSIKVLRKNLREKKRILQKKTFNQDAEESF